MGGTGANEGMPEVGARCADPDGFLAHQKHFLTGRWAIISRPRESTNDEAQQITTARGEKAAARAFQQARMTDCSDDEVIEALEPVLGGWVIRERAGRLDERNTFPVEPGEVAEQVWGQNGDLIASIRLERPRQWYLALRVNDDGGSDETVFELSRSVKDGVHDSRDDAIRAAQRLVPDAAVADDDGWLDEWTTQFGRLQRAGVATSFTHNMDILGTTGTTCAAPGCNQEAQIRITRSGPDIITTSRMVCPDHGGTVLAHHTPAPGPDAA